MMLNINITKAINGFVINVYKEDNQFDSYIADSGETVLNILADVLDIQGPVEIPISYEEEN